MKIKVNYGACSPLCFATNVVVYYNGVVPDCASETRELGFESFEIEDANEHACCYIYDLASEVYSAFYTHIMRRLLELTQVTDLCSGEVSITFNAETVGFGSIPVTVSFDAWETALAPVLFVDGYCIGELVCRA